VSKEDALAGIETTPATAAAPAARQRARTPGAPDRGCGSGRRDTALCQVQLHRLDDLIATGRVDLQRGALFDVMPWAHGATVEPEAGALLRPWLAPRRANAARVGEQTRRCRSGRDAAGGRRWRRGIAYGRNGGGRGDERC